MGDRVTTVEWADPGVGRVIIAVSPEGLLLTADAERLVTLNLDGQGVAVADLPANAGLAGYSPSGAELALTCPMATPTFDPMPVRVMDVATLATSDVVAPVRDGLAKWLPSWHGDGEIWYLQYRLPIVEYDIVRVERSGLEIGAATTELTRSGWRVRGTADRTFDECLVVVAKQPGDPTPQLVLVDGSGRVKSWASYGVGSALLADAVVDVGTDGASLIVGGQSRVRAASRPFTYVHRSHGAATAPFEPWAATLDPSGEQVAAIVMHWEPEKRTDVVVWSPASGRQQVVATLSASPATPVRLTWTLQDALVAWTAIGWAELPH
jgi:hypothetical protein